MQVGPDELNEVLRAVIDRALADGYVVSGIAAGRDAIPLLTEITDPDAIVVMLVRPTKATP